MLAEQRNAVEVWELVKEQPVFINSMLHTINEIVSTRTDTKIGDSFVSNLEAKDESSNSHYMSMLITVSNEEFIVRPFFLGVLLDLSPLVVDAIDVEKYAEEASKGFAADVILN